MIHLEWLFPERLAVHFLRNASWRLTANVLAIGVSAVAFPLVARRMGVEAYGQLAIVTGFAGLVSQIFGLRLWDAVVKFLAEFVTSGDAARAWAFVRLMYLIDLGTAILVLVVLIVAAPFASTVLLHAPLGWLFVLAGLQILGGATSGVSTAILRVFDRFRFLSSVDIVAAFARAGLVLVFVFAGWSAGGAILGYTLTQAGQSVALSARAISSLRSKFAAPIVGEIRGPLRARLREIAGFLFNLNLDTYRKAITANADTVILGYLATPSAVGLYKVARQMAGYVGQLGNPFYEVIYPEIARRWYGPSAGQAIRLMRLLSLGLGLVFVPGFLLSIVVARPVILLVFGAEYLGAAPLFLVLLLTNIWFIWVWVPAWMLTAGHSATLVWISLFSALASLALMIVLGTRYAALGVALGAAANPFISAIPIAWFLFKHRQEFALFPMAAQTSRRSEI